MNRPFESSQPHHALDASEAADSKLLDRLTELRKFKQLRLNVLAAQETLITQRVMTNPIPDEEEFSAGAYREQIEPQCREAIFAMRRKGYRTGSSGFAYIDIAGIRFS